MKKINHYLAISAALLLAVSSSFAGGQANQSEGSSVRDNPTLVGGVRGDGKMQNRTESVVVSFGTAVTSVVAKATAGTFYWVDYTNANAGTRYLQLHNAATLPANGAVPLVSIPVATGANVKKDFMPGIWCATGIVVANSTTQATLTIGSADGTFTVGKR